MNNVTLNHICKRIGKIVILNDINYQFGDRGLYCLVGDSGSGKTTLLDIIAGIDKDYAGDCLVFGSKIASLKENSSSFLRLRKIGYLRQVPDLIELESCLDNMAIRCQDNISKHHLFMDKARALLKTFGLEGKERQSVNKLSGGERSRLALASIMMIDPEIILADEPTAGLDKENARFIFDTLKSYSASHLVIVVTHDKKLANEYSDKTLTLKNKTIIEKNTQSSVDTTLVNPSFELKRPKQKRFTWLRHAVHVLEKKKWRTFLSISLMSFSLFSLGLSIYLNKDLNSRLSSCLTSLTGENSIVMKQRNSNEKSLGKIIACPQESISLIKNTFEDDVLDSGITYIADFEDYFPQENNGYILLNGFEYLIDSFSIRTISDYLWLDAQADLKVYPEQPKVMERSQIVLGLPFDQMTQICFRAGITRSYEDLGNYVLYQNVDLLIKMQNDSWSYTDEQSFSIVGITQSSVPTIYHLDHSFNEYVLEEKMRFPSSDEKDDSLPWILQKVFYIEPSIPKGDFIAKVREDDSFSDYIFEPSNYLYEKTHEVENKASNLNRLYVYEADKHSLGFQKPKEISKWNSIDSFSLMGEYSYVVYPDSLAGGFYNPFFLSDNLESVEQVSDSASRIAIEKAYSAFETTGSVLQGNYLLPRTKGLTFSSDFRNLTSGREPEGVEEICVSTAVAELIGNASSVYVSGVVSWEQDENYLIRNFRTAELKVVGVVESDYQIIYGIPAWNIDFWRDILGMSSFLLEPCTAVFYTNGNNEALLKDISSNYQNYAFSCPSLSISDSLSVVTSYLSIELAFATVLVLAISVILFVTVSVLTSIEQKKDGRSLFYMGFMLSDIHDMYVTNSTLLIFSSMIGACFAVAVGEVVVDKAIQENFGVSLPFCFDAMPIAAVFVFAIFSLLFVAFILKRWTYGRNYRLEKR